LTLVTGGQSSATAVNVPEEQQFDRPSASVTPIFADAGATQLAAKFKQIAARTL